MLSSDLSGPVAEIAFRETDTGCEKYSRVLGSFWKYIRPVNANLLIWRPCRENAYTYLFPHIRRPFLTCSSLFLSSIMRASISNPFVSVFSHGPDV
jgi:hypothetical protein